MAEYSSSESFDFVIVGSGPAGSALASRLARSPKSPKVLLLEAGGGVPDKKALLLAERYSTLMTYTDYNWGYKTAPQPYLHNRQIDYSRGKGLGGSSRINFAAYTTGPKGDYDHWADLVGDDFFNWENSHRRFNKIESYDTEVSPEYKDYVDIKAEHGTDGPLKISYPKIFEQGITKTNDAAVQCGIKRNRDINSGDPIGIGIVAATGTKGIRSTALGYLENAPPNLTIITDSQVTQIAFDGKRAVAAKVGDKLYRASKELVLSAGALDTPKLLLLSGVGPKNELAKHNIGIVHELPGVGQNLRDHWFFPLVIELKPGSDERPSLADPEFVAAARAQFEKDGAGPLAVLYNLQQMGWLRPSEALEQSEEFKSLSEDEKRHFAHPTVPTWEICSHSPPLHPAAKPDKSYSTIIIIGMMPQSHGSVTLASPNPQDAPICDPNLFSHPFDRRNAIEATRIAYKVATSPLLAEDTESIFSAPKSMSDEDILEYAKEFTQTTWHMSCTAKMGKESDPKAVVDKNFKVIGLEGLRIMDVSVTPFTPNCHTVAVAYQIGEMGAERLIKEYGLA